MQSKTNIAVFVILIIACAQAKSKDIFADLKKTEYGQTLVATIQINLQTNVKSKGASESVQIVIGLIKDIRKSLRKQQQDTDNKHREFADACRADFAMYDRKINKYETEVVKYDNLFKIDGPILADRKTEIQARKDEVTSREQMLQELTEENQRQVERHEIVVEEHKAVRAMMHQARYIITENFKSGTNFLQVQATAFSKLASKIRAFKPLQDAGLSHGYAQILNSVALIAERNPVKADQHMIDIVLRIFDDIEDNLESSLEIERTAEHQRLESFKELADKINREINKVKKRYTDLMADVNNLQNAVAQYKNALTNAQAKIEGTKTLLFDRKVVCDEEDRSYDSFNANMSDQIVTCGNALYLMEDKKALLMRYAESEF